MSSGRNVTWRGLTAAYTPAELDLMRQLREHGALDELFVIHEIKARLSANLRMKVRTERSRGRAA